MPDFTYDASPSIFNTPAGSIRGWTRTGTQDWGSLYSCIVEDEYELRRIFQPGMSLLDIGGHVGGVGLLACSLGAHSVTVVEALPENCAVIQRNYELNGYDDRLTLINRAIARRDNELVPIYYGDTATETGRVHQFIGHFGGGAWTIPSAQNSIEVLSISLNKLLDDAYYDVVKFDCEGSEWPALASATDITMRDIGTIVAELHPIDDATADPTARFLEMFPGWTCKPLRSQIAGSHLHMVQASRA